MLIIRVCLNTILLWKAANITPIHKKDSKSEPKNYRPVSLLSIVGKIMERIIFRAMYNFFEEMKSLSPLQAAYRPQSSTVTQLIELYDFIQKSMDEGKECVFLFCDMSKAFDRVWHEGLLYKLEKMGITGNLLEWAKSYLKDRRQQVVINGQASEVKMIESGVPQGSILGPLFFLVYMNDIADDLQGNIKLYADDVTLYVDYTDQAQAKEVIEDDLRKIEEWAKKWYMQFNPTKTEQVHFTRKRSHIPIEIMMEDGAVTIHRSHKHLGVILQRDGKWSEHVEEISRKANRRLDILRHHQKILDRSSLAKLYTTYIRPLLEYGCSVWNSCSIAEEEKLESIQRKAIRIVTGAKKGTSHARLYDEVGWPTLKERRTYQNLKLLYKMIHGEAPPGLIDILPENRAARNPYNVRASQELDPPKASTEAYAKSFIPETCRKWNNLPEEVRTTDSFDIFKDRTCPKPEKPPGYYNTGKRKGQIWLTRLRVENADLNENLYNRNLSNSKVCGCGAEEETTEHYLLICPLYTAERETLQESIESIELDMTTALLLKGSPNLSYDTNANIMNSVITFICDTKRFL